jgi:hypothetical protein
MPLSRTFTLLPLGSPVQFKASSLRGRTMPADQGGQALQKAEKHDEAVQHRAAGERECRGEGHPTIGFPWPEI